MCRNFKEKREFTEKREAFDSIRTECKEQNQADKSCESKL